MRQAHGYPGHTRRTVIGCGLDNRLDLVVGDRRDDRRDVDVRINAGIGQLVNRIQTFGGCRRARFMLERRFAERVQIQPSYWSQIKGRSRQIGERLARQFEHCCHKPPGWMDVPHGSGMPASAASAAFSPASAPSRDDATRDDTLPRDDDERFIMGLVLTFYRRHPQRARTRLLDLLGEVLTPAGSAATSSAPAPAPSAARSVTPLSAAAEDAHALWQRTQSGVAPLKRKK